jgi:iron complex transport system substrate-binding protein
VARRLGCVARGETLVHKLERELESLRVTPAVPARVMVEWWPRPVIVAGRQSWITDLLQRIGAINAFAHLEARSGMVTTAAVLEARPELIVVSWCGAKRLRPELVMRRAGWDALDARVIAVPESGLGRPGPRLLEGMRAISAALRTHSA